MIIEPDFKARQANARRKVFNAERRAARAGHACNVVLHPTALAVPTVDAYARSIGLGTEADGWTAADLEGRSVAYHGAKPGEMTYLFDRSGEPYRVPPGTRASDIVRVAMRSLRGVPLADLSEASAQTAWEAVVEALDDDAGRCVLAMLEGLAARAVSVGWLKSNPFDGEVGPEAAAYQP